MFLDFRNLPYHRLNIKSPYNMAITIH